MPPSIIDASAVQHDTPPNNDAPANPPANGPVQQGPPPPDIAPFFQRRGANDAPLPPFVPEGVASWVYFHFSHVADQRPRAALAVAITMVADGVVVLLHMALGNRMMNHPRLVIAIAALLLVVGGIIYIIYALDGPSLLLVLGGIPIAVALKLIRSLYSAPILATGPEMV
jgi:hypothetical protein